MLNFSRREFLALGAAAIAGRGFTISPTEDILQHPRQNIETLERPRVLTAARRYLKEPPRTIVSAPATRSAGGLHDYFSEADYFWPDPKNPNGPYVQRDGMSNPGNFSEHRKAMVRMSVQVPALAAAWLVTRNQKYADHAARHLRAWFIDARTRISSVTACCSES